MGTHWAMPNKANTERLDNGKVFITELIAHVQHNSKDSSFIFQKTRSMDLDFPGKATRIKFTKKPLWALQFPISAPYKQVFESINKIKTLNIHLSFQMPDGRWLNFSSNVSGFSYENIRYLFYFIFIIIMLFAIYLSLMSLFSSALRNVRSSASKIQLDIQSDIKKSYGFPGLNETLHTLKSMQSDILRLMTERAQMVSAISHDLRLPLTRMRLGQEMDEKYNVKDEINEMDSMIEALLEYAKLDPVKEKKKTFLLDVLLQTCCYEFEDMGHNVAIEQLDRSISYFGAQLSIKRCIDNILKNATKFGTEVHVSLIQDDKQVCINIRDNGPGIREDEFQNIFRPFYKTIDGQKSGKSGSGLGLSIVKDIIDYHGGNIQFSNHPEGGLVVALNFL